MRFNIAKAKTGEQNLPVTLPTNNESHGKRLKGPETVVSWLRIKFCAHSLDMWESLRGVILCSTFARRWNMFAILEDYCIKFRV